jgi:hypothetical protein
MGGKQIVASDFRPFFFRAVKYGFEHGIFSQPEIEKFIDDGVELSLNITKRYYDVVHIAHLRKATAHACGVLSLALLEKCGNDPIRAAVFIKTEGLIRIFRMGWGMIFQLVEKRGLADLDTFSQSMREREALELVSSDYEERWMGWLLFCCQLEKYEIEVGKNNVQAWLANNFFGFNKWVLAVRHDFTLARTGFLFLGAGIVIHEPPSLGQVQEMADLLVADISQVKNRIERKLKILRSKFDLESQKYFDLVVEGFREKILGPVEIAARKGKPEVQTFLSSHLVISESISQAFRDVYSGTQLNFSRKTTGELLGELKSSNIEKSELELQVKRAAIIAILQGRVFRKQLTAEAIILLLACASSEEIGGKIAWHRLPWDSIESVYRSPESKEKESFVLNELIATAKKPGVWRWWRARPSWIESEISRHQLDNQAKKKRAVKKGSQNKRE